MKINRKFLLLTILAFVGVRLFPQLHVSYKLQIDTSDLSGYKVEMLILHPPAVVLLAMSTHHEYDDRWWRFIEHFKVETTQGVKCRWAKEDSAVWKISTTGARAGLKISYQVHFPPVAAGNRASHRPFLTLSGGLVGEIHSFMYLVGYEGLPATVRLEIPGGWQIASGLESGADPFRLMAPDMRTLLDSPILIGRLQSWEFTVQGIPHRIVYWQLPGAAAFDTARLVNAIRRIVQQVINLFGKAPYHHYTFLLQDGAYGALEHLNSVTIGAASTLLSANMAELYGEIAHEFFHTWNLIRMRPAEYTDLNYGLQQQSAGLWWSEGLSMLYADLLLRCAGLPAYDSSRITHLEELLHRYYSAPGNRLFSPEKVSLASNDEPGSLGDYSASVHLQGELLGVLLDLIVRDASNGQRSIDDVMRAMYDRHSEGRGFYGVDIEQVVKEICGCDVHSFFQSYVREGKEMDFNRYLSLIGLRARKKWMVVKDEKGQPAVDPRVYAWRRPGDSLFRLVVTDPGSCWGKAGLHTGDLILQFNGQPISSTAAFRSLMKSLHVRDKVQVVIRRADDVLTIRVTVREYEEAIVHILPLGQESERQRELFKEWEKGCSG